MVLAKAIVHVFVKVLDNVGHVVDSPMVAHSVDTIHNCSDLRTGQKR